MDSTNVCQDCYENCSKCLGPNTNECLLCDPGFFISYEKNVSSSGQCEQCSGICKTCSHNSRYCKSCTPPMVLTGHNCLPACLPGFYFDAQEDACRTCSDNCLTCIENATRCQTCKSVLEKLSSTFVCEDNCFGSTFLDSNNECENCNTTLCDKCEYLDNHCTGCSGALLLENHKCVANCS